MNAFYIFLAVKILKKVLPGLKRKALESPNVIDDTAISLAELAIELYETGTLTAKTIAQVKSGLKK